MSGEALTRSFAVHRAQGRMTIRCNSVHPSGVDTPMARGFGGRAMADRLASPPGGRMMMDVRGVGLSLAVAALSSSACAAPMSPETQIRQREDAVNAAYAANDLSTYFTFYADDLRALFAEGPTTLAAYRSEWTAFVRSGGGIVSFKDSGMRVQVSPKGDAAVASYLAAVTTRYPGKGDVRSSYSETDVWYRRGDQWKIVEIHYSENPPATQ